ncbi:MalY/PatB family protein [Deinococcus humi]|uniref:cysteine-S-conjugate beta-lyase n=1 Tax=Deinococcus humi TaxID=662880 RepID=A0A7W8JSC1_9DEIO|nr:PatB family C-S lyase [Deinococcus humi]MBB5362352.1 cystathionine beta-lyase [Deinococcus humi]GGO29203.1 aminotransferase class I [Deinococcus humi]
MTQTENRPAYPTLSPAELRHPDSLKWTLYGDDVIPMWIADMDFPVAPPILAALHERLERGLGYHQLMGDGVLDSLLRAKLETHGLGDLPEGGLALLPGVVPGIYSSVAALTQPGEKVLTMTPVYHPFHLSITGQGREVSAVALLNGPDGYEIDWEGMEAAAQDTGLMLLCHPHNPTGRVWTHAELEKLRDLAVRNNLYVVSDELHADLRFTDGPFESFAADKRVQDRTITLTGPCKAFNTAGLGIGVMIGHDAELVKRVRAAAGGLMGHEGAMSVTMWQAALRDGGPWLADTVAYLRANRDFLTGYLREHLPTVRFHPVESTYLAWLDLRDCPHAADIQKFLLEEARVAVHDGPTFAPEAFKPESQGFIRLNFATSREILTEALERLRRALGESQ